MEEIFRQIAGYGPLGLGFVVLLWVIKTLYERNIAIQDKRIEENRETIKALHDAADAIKEQTKAVTVLTDIVKMQKGG